MINCSHVVARAVRDMIHINFFSGAIDTISAINFFINVCFL